MKSKENYTPQEVSQIVSAYLNALHNDRGYLKLKLISMEGAVKDVLNNLKIPLNVRQALDEKRIRKDLTSLVD